MRKYRGTDGGIEIDKTDPSPMRKARSVSMNNGPTKIDAKDIIDTAISYQIPSVGINSNKNGGSECKVCGAKTAYDNRHICIDCWKKYKDEIISGIKDALEEVEIEIE